MHHYPLQPILQTCPLDVEAAIDLLDVIVGIQREPSPREFWVVYRKDVDPADVETMQGILRKKFNPLMLKARIFAVGHPQGANALWHSTMLEAQVRLREGHTMATGVLTFEPDSVPLRINWIESLEDEWVHAHAMFVGHVDDAHMNGNAIFPTGLLNTHFGVVNHSETVAWDWAHRQFFKQNARDTDLIFQEYRRSTINEHDFIRMLKNGVRPALYHGVRDSSARDLARKHLVF